ncbi:MAG: hypothetical protein V3U02_04525 [Calditrichia bacterium]
MEGNDNYESSKVTRYREEAQAEIKGNISLYYKLSTLEVNFDNSQASGLLRRIEILLAAGWVLIESFGTESQDTSNDGKAKIDLAHALLDKIAMGETKLFDSNNVEYAKRDTVQNIAVEGVPTSSEDTNQDGNETNRRFDMSKKW